MAGAALYAAYNAKDWFHAERVKFKFNLLLKNLDDIQFLIHDFEQVIIQVDLLKSEDRISIEKLRIDIPKLTLKTQLILSDLQKLSILDEKIGRGLFDLIMIIYNTHIRRLILFINSNDNISKRDRQCIKDSYDCNKKLISEYLNFKSVVYNKINQSSKM
ncbi:hypothetical protein ACIPTT_06120 [Pectobacterium versatile]